MSNHDLSIFRKKYQDLQNPEGFRNYVPVSCFPKQMCFYIEEEYLGAKSFYKDKDKILRFINMKLEILPVTESTNTKLQNIYEKYKQRNDKEFFNTELFYREFLTVLEREENRILLL